MSAPKKNILLLINIAVSRFPLSIPKNEINPLKVAPTNEPLIIEAALSDWLSSCPASRTDAHANPSGYGNLSSFFKISSNLERLIELVKVFISPLILSLKINS